MTFIKTEKGRERKGDRYMYIKRGDRKKERKNCLSKSFYLIFY